VIFDLEGQEEAINKAQPDFKNAQIERKKREVAFREKAEKKKLALKKERSKKLNKNGT